MPVLDTSFLIDLMRRDPMAISLLQELEEEGAILASTPITAFELYKGAFLSKAPSSNLSVVRQILEGVVILPLNDQVFEVFGALSASLQRQGKSIGDFDEIIAAVALCFDAILITRDDHFSSIPGLTIRGYGR